MICGLALLLLCGAHILVDRLPCIIFILLGICDSLLGSDSLVFAGSWLPCLSPPGHRPDNLTAPHRISILASSTSSSSSSRRLNDRSSRYRQFTISRRFFDRFSFLGSFPRFVPLGIWIRGWIGRWNALSDWLLRFCCSMGFPLVAVFFFGVQLLWRYHSWRHV